MPNISKTLLIIKRKVSFTDFLHHTIGKRNILVSYVFRELYTVPGVAPPMAKGKSYS